MKARKWTAALLTVVALVAAGGGSSSNGDKPDLVVSAASSLKDAFNQYAQKFPDATVRASFAGSDDLAAQIEQGVKPDVFASANTKLPDELFQKGLVQKPVVFAGNRLVIAVPASGGEVTSLADPADRATIEEEHNLEQCTRERERKLLTSVAQAIGRIDSGDYGWCEETGDPIGIPRLLANPTASVTVEAQQRREARERMFGA